MHVDVPVPMEAPQQAPASLRPLSEIDGQYSPTRLEDPRHLGRTPPARRAGQMVEHDGREDDVELRIPERQRLRNGVLEDDIDASSRGFPPCARDHVGRCVNAEHAAGRRDVPSRRDGERSGAAADVEDGVAGLQGGQAQRPLTKRSVPPEREQPHQEVVTRGTAQDRAGGRGAPMLLDGVVHRVALRSPHLAPDSVPGTISFTRSSLPALAGQE
jgi:hypothetical protein